MVQFTEVIGQLTNKSIQLRHRSSTMKIASCFFLHRGTFQTAKLEKSSTIFTPITNRVIYLSLSPYTMSHNPQPFSSLLLETSGPEVWLKVAQEHSNVPEGKAKAVSLVE
jgi:hypothetical protein